MSETVKSNSRGAVLPPYAVFMTYPEVILLAVFMTSPDVLQLAVWAIGMTSPEVLWLLSFNNMMLIKHILVTSSDTKINLNVVKCVFLPIVLALRSVILQQ